MSRPSQTESAYTQTVQDGKCLYPDRPRRKVPMSKLSCVHQTVVRSCPDFPALRRNSCIHQIFVRSCADFRAYTRHSCVQQTSCLRVQTFVRSCPDFRVFMSRLSCVHVQTDFHALMLTFVRSAEFRACIILSCLHVQTFVPPCPDFCAIMFRLPCTHVDFRAFSRISCVHHTFVRSCPDVRAFTRLSCNHVQIFVRSPVFRAFSRISDVHQIFARSCPDFRAFTSLSCVHVQTFVRSSMFPDEVILNARRPPCMFIFGLDILASV